MLCCTAHDSVVGKAQNEPGQREHNASFGLNPHGSSDRSRIAVIRTWNGCYRQGNGPRDWIRPGRRKLLPRHPVGIVRGVCFGILRLWRVAYLALGSVVQQGSAKTRPEGFNCRRGAVEGPADVGDSELFYRVGMRVPGEERAAWDCEGASFPIPQSRSWAVHPGPPDFKSQQVWVRMYTDRPFVGRGFQRLCTQRMNPKNDRYNRLKF